MIRVKRDGQCTCNVTLRCGRLLYGKSNEYYTAIVCICSLRYPACNARAPYRLWPAPLYKNFPHYLIKDMIFQKEAIEYKIVFIVSLQILSDTFLILKRTERDMIENIFWSSCRKVKNKAIPLQGLYRP